MAALNALSALTSQWIRVCEVCGRENPAEEIQCTCGALLAHIDLVERVVAPAPVAALSEEMLAPALLDAVPPPTQEENEGRCPHADCAMPNPPGEENCLYCDRPIQVAPAVALAPVDLAGLGGLQGLAVRPSDAPLRRLPAALEARWQILRPLKASGAEADLYEVVAHAGPDHRVAKVYRRGMAPSSAVLARLRDIGGQGFRPVVQLHEFGESEGHAWELLEYCPHGSLRDWLAAGPRARSDVEALVRELSGALEAVHAAGILHRDLKPENVLVRRHDPLQLALADFGTAALQRGTQHFTNAARTTLYAAPEVLAGLIDAATDWWAVGMIVLEAASGRHPFVGLSDLVIAHRLATQPVKIEGVADERIAMLCAGLLLRDPKRRWKAAEMTRWLAGDKTLDAPQETAGAHLRPYRLGDCQCANPRELAAALVQHWEAGGKDLARGSIVKWLDNEWHDQNLLRRVQDVLERRDFSDERKLLACVALFDERLPPAWRGRPVSPESLLTAARAAQDDEAQRWIVSLYEEQVLSAWGEAQAALNDLEHRWRKALDDFGAYWNAIAPALTDARQAARRLASTGGEVANFDALVFGRDQAWDRPILPKVLPLLLITVLDPAAANSLKTAEDAASARWMADAPWLQRLPLASTDAAGALIGRHFVLPLAERFAQKTRELRQRELAARGLQLQQMEKEIDASLGHLQLAAENGDDVAARGLVDALFGQVAPCAAIVGVGPIVDRLRAQGVRFSVVLPTVLAALDEREHQDRVMRVWWQPMRILTGLSIAALLWNAMAPVAGIVSAVLMAGGLWWVRQRAQHAVAAWRKCAIQFVQGSLRRS